MRSSTPGPPDASGARECRPVQSIARPNASGKLVAISAASSRADRIMLDRIHVTSQNCLGYKKRFDSERVKVCNAVKWCEGVWREQVAGAVNEWVNRQLEQLQPLP